MRKIVVSEFVTVDGVMQAPGGDGDFELAGWTMPYWNDEIGQFKFEELDAADALLLGRVTYEGFAAAWPSMTDEAGFADRMNRYTKYVVSSTLKQADWNNSTVLSGDVVEEVTRRKEEPGKDILVGGSATLVQALMGHGLVDELRLAVYPGGAGRRHPPVRFGWPHRPGPRRPAGHQHRRRPVVLPPRRAVLACGAGSRGAIP